MGSLGSLGTPRPPRDDTFNWFGDTVRVNPDITDVTVSEFMEEGAHVSATRDEVAAYTFIKRWMREFVHPDDFDTYWQTGRRERQTHTDHMAVMHALIAAASGRPTKLSSVSTSGPEGSEDGSTGDLLQRVTEGRPDLELGLMNELERRRMAGTG